MQFWSRALFEFILISLGHYSQAWSQIGPEGGFIAAVYADPYRSGRWMASGDDSSGMYESTNGSAWRLIKSTPINWSAYSVNSIRTSSKELWIASSPFGRGVLFSNNGTEWTQVGNARSGKIIVQTAALTSQAKKGRASCIDAWAATTSGLLWHNGSNEDLSSAWEEVPCAPC